MRRHARVVVLSIVTFNYWFRERDANRQIFFIDVHKCSFYNDRTAIRVPKFIVSDFYYSIPAEAVLLTIEGVTKLIADAPGIADGFIYVSMRVTVYPVFDAAAGDKVAKFGCKGPVYRATLELVYHKLERRYMVSGDYDVLGLTFRHTSLNKLTATLMLLIETLG